MFGSKARKQFNEDIQALVIMINKANQGNKEERAEARKILKANAEELNGLAWRHCELSDSNDVWEGLQDALRG